MDLPFNRSTSKNIYRSIFPIRFRRILNIVSSTELIEIFEVDSALNCEDWIIGRRVIRARVMRILERFFFLLPLFSHSRIASRTRSFLVFVNRRFFARQDLGKYALSVYLANRYILSIVIFLFNDF